MTELALALTYDDVLLVPRRSPVSSRYDVSTRSRVVENERLGRGARGGVVEEVLRRQPPRMRVWDDGYVSIISPQAGAVRVRRAAA